MDYMTAARMSIRALAKMTGIGYRTIDEYRLGRMLPGLIMAALIERATAGGVPITSWLGTTLARKHLDRHMQKSGTIWTEHDGQPVYKTHKRAGQPAKTGASVEARRRSQALKGQAV